MRYHLTALAAVILLVVAGSAQAAPPPHWTGPLRWHLDQSTTTRFIYWRVIGNPNAKQTVPDDTIPVSYDAFGAHIVTRSAPWKPITIRQIPKNAKAVRLAFQTVISRGPSPGNAVLYAFVKSPQSRCCVGPEGFRNYPVDYSSPGQIFHEGEVVHGVAVDPWDEVRGFSTADVAVQNRTFDFAWGYRKMPDDALGVEVYLIGYAD